MELSSSWRCKGCLGWEVEQAPKAYNNLRELFNYPSILTLFDIGIPKQIACDFKVAALLVGIQQGQNKHPRPYCLWRKGDSCTGNLSMLDLMMAYYLTWNPNRIMLSTIPLYNWKNLLWKYLHWLQSIFSSVLRIDCILLQDHRKQPLQKRVANFINDIV